MIAGVVSVTTTRPLARVLYLRNGFYILSISYFSNSVKIVVLTSSTFSGMALSINVSFSISINSDSSSLLSSKISSYLFSSWSNYSWILSEIRLNFLSFSSLAKCSPKGSWSLLIFYLVVFFLIFLSLETIFSELF